jgi:hypothetical protein
MGRVAMAEPRTVRASALTAIADLRQVAAQLEQSGDRLLERHAAALHRYDEEARLGLTLDDALGLSQRGGAGAWWVQEARARRDEAIRLVATRFYGNHDPGSAADEIARDAGRRMVARSAAVTEKEALIDAALRAGPRFPGQQRLRQLLRGAL